MTPSPTRARPIGWSTRLRPPTHDTQHRASIRRSARADLYPFDAGSLNRTGQLFGDFLVDVDDHVAVVVP